MTIKIITVGSPSSAELTTLIAAYEKRLPRTVQISWDFVRPGQGDRTTSIRAEAESILSRLPTNARTVLLDETGTQSSSEKFAHLCFADGRDVSFIIGGAYGVDSSVFERADSVMSMSELVFPHQLVRLLLAEQLYRAWTIHIGHPYHHA